MSPGADAGEDWLAKTAEHLEWPRLLSHVQVRCRSASARRRGLSLARDRQDAARRLGETRELLSLLQRGSAPPLDDLRDVEAHLQRLERAGVLDAPALADVLATLDNARRLRAYLAEHRAAAPALCAACETDPSLDALEEQLRAALSPDGRLCDDASAELRALRSEIGNLRTRIVARLEQLILRHEAVLSDRYYTLREGRYVLPVRRDAHERVPGIVHTASASGASIFVEPRAVVAHGNRLKMAEAELEREELRILAALSELVRERLPALRGAADAIDRLDLRHAAARLGLDFGGSVPELADGGELSLQGARHPLLALDALAAAGDAARRSAPSAIVENDVTLTCERGLVISGPNAGGKTVLLKLLGLCALMLRHGLPIPAREGSRVGFFARVLTDVGDEQSTATNLSTFSAHIRNLAAILAQAEPDSLVLLDELATGTDPEEGAALACAVVEALSARGAAFAVTTHYEPLKALSLRDPRLRSASVGFDFARMEPSFKLLLDVPGASSALSVARRFGIAETVIARAQAILPEQSREFGRLVRELGERAQALAETQQALDEERARLSRTQHAASEALTRQRKQGDAELARELDRLLGELKSARRELEAARKTLREQEQSKTRVLEASRRVDRVAARVALGGDLAAGRDSEAAQPAATPRLAERDIQPGLNVYVPHLRSEGVVIEGPHKGRTRVAAGPLKLWVQSSELRAAPAKAQTRPARESPPPRRLEGRTPDNTLNVRGMRVDDALGLVESFVDRIYASDLRVGYVLHGHGTGALREAVRKHLQDARFALTHIGPAEHDQGGDAVTVFRFGAEAG